MAVDVAGLDGHPGGTVAGDRKLDLAAVRGGRSRRYEPDAEEQRAEQCYE
jgi:hypothetical protein